MTGGRRRLTQERGRPHNHGVEAVRYLAPSGNGVRRNLSTAVACGTAHRPPFHNHSLCESTAIDWDDLMVAPYSGQARARSY